MNSDDPFHFESVSWDEYADSSLLKRDFEFFAEPISAEHLKQVRVITTQETRRLRKCASGAGLDSLREQAGCFARVEALQLIDCNSEEKVSEVRRWLFKRGIPFERHVFAIGDQDYSLETTWKIVVRYWEAFENCPGGLGTLVFDHTLQWAVWFDHEEVILFGSNLVPD